MDTRTQRILYIDTQRCMGCRACETVCKLENDLPAGPRYTMVTEVETGTGLTEKLNFLPVPCQHCGPARRAPYTSVRTASCSWSRAAASAVTNA